MTRRLTVGEAGERELIRLLEPWVQYGKGVNGSTGVGDDCAVLRSSLNQQTVLTTDMLIAGTHFLVNAETDWKAVGRKSAGANISDLAAMGAQPVALLVSIAVPASFLVNDIFSLYQGMNDMSTRFCAPILGGDTTRSDQVCISITAIGLKEAGAADCLRSDVRLGDFVYVTGDLGGSRAGLETILEPDAASGLPVELVNELKRDHLSPTPRVEAGLALARLFPRVAMIDISDSLHNEASLLGEVSGVQLTLHLESIPVSAEAFNYCKSSSLDASEFALFSGEEYELLFTLPTPPEKLFEQLQGAGVDCPVTHVGTVNPGSGVVLLRGGHPVDPDDETFVHFP